MVSSATTPHTRASASLAFLKKAFLYFYIVCAPVLFAAQAIVPVYFMNYQLTAVILSQPGQHVWFSKGHRNVALAVSLCALLAFLELMWLSTISYCFFTTWVTGRRWEAPSAPDEHGQQLDPKHPSGRRWCEICSIFKGNRTYHCKPLGRCLPFYDHFCECWLGAVWGYNAKAYLVFYVFIILHQIACTVVGSWILPKHNPYHYKNWPASAVGIASINFLYTVYIAYGFWRDIALQNVFRPELCSPLRTFLLLDGFYDWKTRYIANSPYHHGWKANYHFVIGPWWSFLLFWTYSPIKDACRLEDYTMRDLKATRPYPSPDDTTSASDISSSSRPLVTRSLDDLALAYGHPTDALPAATRRARPKTD